MTPRPRARRRPPLLAAVAALVLAAAGVFAAAPASAHDVLVSTDPAADTTLEALPEQLTLTFSAELLAGGGNEVQVTDAVGASLVEGAATVDGVTLVQPLVTDGGSGAITVVWRAVSSDGHPISGQYGFTVTAPAPAPTQTEAEEPTASPTPEDTASAPAETETPAPVDGENAANPLPWIIGAIVLLIAIGGGVVAILVRLARRSDDGEDAESDGTAGR